MVGYNDRVVIKLNIPHEEPKWEIKQSDDEIIFVCGYHGIKKEDIYVMRMGRFLHVSGDVLDFNYEIDSHYDMNSIRAKIINGFLNIRFLKNKEN